MQLRIDNLETPALLIERSILEDNIDRMQRLADMNNIKLRPHVKTHKSPYIAKKQIKRGAVGIACAKVGEAEVMASHGIDDIQIANIIVGESKIRRMKKLVETGVKISCCVDSLYAARSLSEVFGDDNSQIDVFILLDTGFHRCGLDKYNDILNLANEVRALRSLRLKGLLSHDGRVYSADTDKKMKGIINEETSRMHETADNLKKDGFAIDEISVGSTPGARYLTGAEGITEVRPGNYVYYDMIQAALGSAKLENCALNVLATVISVPPGDRAIIDAGSKALNLDKGAHGLSLINGYGHIINKKGIISRLSEEHGIITNRDGNFTVGEKIRIIPNHACVVSNLFDYAWMVDGEYVIEKIDIEARGRSQ